MFKPPWRHIADSIRATNDQQPVRFATRLQDMQTVSRHVHPERVYSYLSF